MNSKNRVPMRLVILAIMAAAGPLIVVGCALDKNGNGPGGIVARVGGHSGVTVEPKRCLLKVAIISRPFDDSMINNVVWRVADEQVIPAAERRAWEVNGLRVGRISGDLPLELEAALRETTPQKKVTPTNFFVDNGEPTLVIVSPAVEQASLLLNRDNRIFGNDFKDASGFFRVIPEQEGANSVSLRLVPEIHHGPVQRNFQALPTASPLGPQEFMMNNGQQEETIRDLATTLTLAPGQIAVIGCRPEFKSSLGSFMLTEAVAHNDHRLEKLVLIWASRNFQGKAENDGASNANERLKLFKRLKGLPPRSMAPRPEPPTPEIPLLDAVTPAPVVSAASASAASAATPPAGNSAAVPAAASSSVSPSQSTAKPTTMPTETQTPGKNGPTP